MPEVGTTTATVASMKLWLFASIFAFLEYFGIPKEPFTLLGLLMFLDMVTGIAKQKAVNMSDDKEHFVAITSHRWWLGVMKKLVTLLVICAVAISIKALGFNGATLLTLSIAGFVTAEIYSIVQNAYIINTGKFLPEFDAAGMLLKAMAWVLRNRVEVQVQEIEKQAPKVTETENEKKL